LQYFAQMARIFFLLILFCTDYAYSSVLSGYIKDKATGESIPGATVFLPDLNRGAVSDIFGFYQIKDMPKGIVKLKISFMGYDALLVQLNIKNETALDFLLEPALIKMKEVVISSGRASLSEETPYQIKSVSPNEIFSGGEVSIPAALSRIPGVNQIGFGPGIGKPVIRGLSFSRVLTVYQGARFENQQWGEDHGFGLSDAGIEGIEIIKGPASLIYGSGALGGVINIIDEYPAAAGSMQGDFLQNFYSNTLGSKSSLGIKGANDKGISWSFRAGKESHADYIGGEGRSIGNSRFNTTSGKATLGYSKDRSSTKFTYVYFEQNLGIIEEDEMQNSLATVRFDRKIQLPFQDVKDHLFSMQHLHKLRKGVIKLNLSSHTNIRKEIEEDFNTADLALLLNTNNLDARYIFNIGQETEVVSGIQSFSQSNRNLQGASEILIPNAQVNDFSAFILTTKKLSRLNISGGIRYDYRIVGASSPDISKYVLPGNFENMRISRTFSGFSGSAGLTAAISEKLHFKSNLASGFRAPDLAELFSNGEHPGTNRFEKGNVSFNREQNLELDAGVIWRSSEIFVEAASFYNFINNYIFFNPTAERIKDLKVWEFMQENVLLKGGEFSIKAIPAALKIIEAGADYSFVHATIANNGLPLPQIPANRINAYMKIKLLKKIPTFWNVNSRFVFSQHKYHENEEFTPQFYLINTGFNTSFNLSKYAVEAGLTVNNLFNRFYYEHQSVIRSFGVPDMGRNITLNLRCKF
jgi:iron complex outermembrane recepter protein